MKCFPLPIPPPQRGEGETEDATLFRAAVGQVAPLAEQNRIEPQKLPRVQRLPDPPRAIPDTLSDSLDEHTPVDFLRNGLSNMTLRKLRRTPIQDSLDLHGSHIEGARTLLQQFLHEAAIRELRCVLVIHGKGSSGGEAVLRRLTRHWLMQRPDVLAYCDAPPRAGGSGAALVLLKAVYAPMV